jgi:tRNA nucleotidyltransferase (CCA-adding enzyme)
MTNNIKIFLVGGAVRDTFIGVPNKDKDFTVVAPSFQAMKDMIVAKGGKIFLETPEFFTVRANVPELGSADFVLARKDGAYRDGRSPESVEVGTIVDDLARRDFTMNAIAIDTEDELNIIDPFNGLADIKDGLIRAVGNPRIRFEEDALRMFRAVRFAITKNFRLHTETASAIGRFTPRQFAGVSTERVREELLKMFQADSFRAIKMLHDFPVLWDVVQQRGIWFKPTVEKR